MLDQGPSTFGIRAAVRHIYAMVSLSRMNNNEWMHYVTMFKDKCAGHWNGPNALHLVVASSEDHPQPTRPPELWSRDWARRRHTLPRLVVEQVGLLDSVDIYDLPARRARASGLNTWCDSTPLLLSRTRPFWGQPAR